MTLRCPYLTVQKLFAIGLLFALLPAIFAPAFAAQPREARQDDASELASETPAAGQVEYAYGSDPLQKLDFWRSTATAPAPLILFVHGGGWKRGDKKNATGAQKVEHFAGEGYAFASINYRLVPTATVEQQAADVAAAVAWVRGNAGRLGIDTTRIILMGHSAGAHLVALVGTTPQYLAAAGLSLSDIRGVIALDGACYDVPRQIAEGGRFMRDTYLEAFGSDPMRQRALSPSLQAVTPRVPPFLIVHIDRADGTAQSEALAKVLVQVGVLAEVYGVDAKGLRGHMEINRSLGSTDYPPTAVVDDWMRKLLRTK